LRGISSESIEELGEFSRQVYMILNRDKIQELLSQIEVITIGTRIDSPGIISGFGHRVLLCLRNLGLKKAGENDGVVPLLSSRLSDERHFQLDHLSHTGAVTLQLERGSQFDDILMEVLSGTSPAKLSEHPRPALGAPFEEHSAESLVPSDQQGIL
jgi:hypothetical protein